MGRWVIEAKGTQQVLFHYCDGASQHDNSDFYGKIWGADTCAVTAVLRSSYPLTTRETPASSFD